MMRLITPDWPAPDGVHAATTTRHGGISQAPFHSLNLGDHVGDNPKHVAANRRKLAEQLALPSEPHWLKQIHGTTVVDLDSEPTGLPEADASTTRTANTVCAVLTADCLPVLFCDRAGTQVAAAHAGWRGLATGVLEATVATFNAPPEEIIAWLGPAIGPQAFEVGEDVRQAFCDVDVKAVEFFIAIPSAVQAKGSEQKWLADVYQLARQRLASIGVNTVYGGGRCTFSETDDFFSFRREGKTGRLASIVWIEQGM